jgi:hypothetical protein
MKKWVIILFLSVLTIIACSYFFIPAKQDFRSTVTANCTEGAATRLIIDTTNWKTWWPEKQNDDSIYIYKNYYYKINKMRSDAFETTVLNGEDSVKGFLQIIAGENNTTQFSWIGTFQFSTNPLKRARQYFQLRDLKNNIDNFLIDVKKYFDDEKNIYGLKIVKEKVKTPSLISIKQNFSHYPTTKEIYALIASLQEYIKKQNGEEVGHPMLNVHTGDGINYEVMVAVPTKNDLPSEGKFEFKRMVLGNILTAEVKGGSYSVENSEKELANYVNDYHKESPAIPYQSLVTNRLVEPDTAKWITGLYYPVFD